ncbi:MAG: DUF1801 domain-containing protein [Lentimicrobium sp.]|uniref:DUF1801 domain-containing protein n=1 Tax=Lentimicrobium sp. TaxID=2034841 RepID=UPI0025D65165|nr:DUF1801 domain-containing protein [Lentimicrobium sp.]MCO5258062.1 DUF1801 domain-containing protein [Lentimicrobium sp.]
MAEIKTRPVDTDVHEFIRTFANTEQKIADSFTLLKLMEEITGYKPVMWGPSIIGFGSYHYKSERSRQEGDWPLAGFSPRKAAISLYVYAGIPAQDEMLKELGKYKMGKACIYVKKLADIRQDVLIRLIQSTVDYIRKKYP